MPKICPDLQNLSIKPTLHYECDACIAMGSTWVYLRTCQVCGLTLCCDSSKNKHATHHYHETGHAVFISAEPKEHWAYCYEHDSLNPTAF